MKLYSAMAKKNFYDIQIVNETAQGDLVIRENTQFNNAIANTVVVEENKIVRLYGEIKKMLILKKGSKAYIHGQVKGQVVNMGGELYTFSV
jgi:hypothetical protein